MRKKLPLKSGIDLAPMVDIIFLLLAYFLINSTLARTTMIPVELPKSVSTVNKQENRIELFIKKDKSIFINESASSIKTLADDLKSRRKPGREMRVILHGDKEVPYQLVITVIDRLQAAGVRNFHLAAKNQ